MMHSINCTRHQFSFKFISTLVINTYVLVVSADSGDNQKSAAK
jgi:hypothetical protein